MKRLALLFLIPVFCAFVNPQVIKKDIKQPVIEKTEIIGNVINTIAPHIEKKLSQEYGIIINKYSQQFDIDWKIVVAIFKQESDFDIKAVNFRTRDFGIGQFNYRNIVFFEIDLGKLLTDADYAILQTYKLLYDLKKRHYHKEIGWYNRYHSGTPALRHKYQRLLNRKFLLIKRALKNEKSRTHGRTTGINVPEMEGNWERIHSLRPVRVYQSYCT